MDCFGLHIWSIVDLQEITFIFVQNFGPKFNKNDKFLLMKEKNFDPRLINDEIILWNPICLSCYKCLLLKFLFKNRPCGIKGQVRVTFCKLQLNAYESCYIFLFAIPKCWTKEHTSCIPMSKAMSSNSKYVLYYYISNDLVFKYHFSIIDNFLRKKILV